MNLDFSIITDHNHISSSGENENKIKLLSKRCVCVQWWWKNSRYILVKFHRKIIPSNCTWKESACTMCKQ